MSFLRFVAAVAQVMIYTISLWGLGCLISLFFVRKLAIAISCARFKQQHGCKPVHKIPQWERILGIDLYRVQMRGFKEKTILANGYKRYQDNGITWSASMLGKTYVNTIDPENIKAMLATNFEDFGIGQRLAALGPLLGEGIFSTDGSQWEHSRALVRPNFTRSQVADLEIFETHIRQLVDQIPRNGATVDLQPLFFQFTLDAATDFLFGESVNSLSALEDSEQQRFGNAFDFAQSKLGLRIRMGKFLDLWRNRQFDESCEIVHEFVDKIVNRTLAKAPFNHFEKATHNLEPTAPGRYIFLDETAKATRNPKRLRDELLNILLAGRDTTASLLSIAFHILVRESEIMAKLRIEVDELQGDVPTYENLKNMKYLKYFLNETLRLYPIVPGNLRFANKNTMLPRGGGPDGQSPIFIPKGQIVAYSAHCLHRRKDIYGPDALKFRPERWEPEEGLRPGWAYLPFNGGPRICVGQQFALAEAGYTIVRLLQEFKAIEDRDGGPFVEKLSLTMASGNGVNVAMIPR